MVLYLIFFGSQVLGSEPCGLFKSHPLKNGDDLGVPRGYVIFSFIVDILACVLGWHPLVPVCL